MKKFFLILIPIIALSGCSSTYLKFITTEHNFGNLQQMKKYSYKFSFTNISKKTVLIESVKGG